MKTLLLGVLLASPVFATWICRGSELPVSHQEIRVISNNQIGAFSLPVVRVPVQVIAKGSAPKWVYVEVAGQAIPEPGIISLVALTSLLITFRRRRG